MKDIIQKLDYIKDFGFNRIYLNPIFVADSKHHYDTNNYLKIDPSLGTMTDFKWF